LRYTAKSVKSKEGIGCIGLPKSDFSTICGADEIEAPDIAGVPSGAIVIRKLTSAASAFR
jgi:hypothetical protein